MPAYYDEEEDFSVASPGRGRRGGSGLSTILGGALGLALLAGGGYWAMTLGARDAADVPVIRAAETAAKERPAEPGGEQTPYRDVAAFEAGNAEADAEVQPTLAPDVGAPAQEDLPMGRLASASPSETVNAPAVAPSARVGHEMQNPTRVAEPAPAQVAALTRIDEEELEPPKAPSLIPSEVELLETHRPRRRIVPHLGEPVPAKGEGSEAAPAYAPVVHERPRDLAARFAAASAAAESAKLELVRRAHNSPVQLQLGAFPERATIEEEWRRIREANSDVLEGRALAVQQTNSGGVTYYRLRVGPFRDGHQANTVCQALKARGHDCLVAINTDRRG